MELLERIAKETDCSKQCLYLVADIKNAHDVNAVMLSDGKRKLGSVAGTEALEIRDMLDDWLCEVGTDDVITVCIDANFKLNSRYPGTERGGSVIRVTGFGRINERIARKFSDKFRKE